MMQNTIHVNQTTGQTSRWFIFSSQNEINRAAVNKILEAAKKAIEESGSFIIVLAGGSTPKSIYEMLSSEKSDWSNWHVYHNDDRCLPIDHPERNSLMARQAWLSHVAIPESQIHDIPAELGNIMGAKTYSDVLQGVRTFDLVLLGLGEDGHTASLFPDQAIDNSNLAVPVFDAPKPPAERVTMSLNRLNDTHAALFLVTGAGKQNAVNDWINNKCIPASLISPRNGVDVYCFGVTIQN